MARGATTTLVTIGDNSQQTPNLATIYVRLMPPDARKASQDELQDRVRKRDRARSSPRTTASASRRSPAFGGGTFSTATVQYILTGPDLEQARPTTRTRSSRS